MSTRTSQGFLAIPDTFGFDRTLYICPGEATISLVIGDVDTDQRVTISLGAAELDVLAAEILRIREERGI